MLESSAIKRLKSAKNLLAFSGGLDSSALFFLLLKECINFDIAIVDYQVRESSKKEVAYAQSLAKTYKKHCFVLKAPKIESNFEAEARKIRYEFFYSLMFEKGYLNLVLAHQLNDRLEWLLMGLSRALGLKGLSGFEAITSREISKDENAKLIYLIRPLLNTSKDEINAFLDSSHIKHFLDESNLSDKYLRNIYRKNYATPLLNMAREQIKTSLNLLSKESRLLYKLPLVCKDKGLYYFKTKALHIDIVLLDSLLKTLGYQMSKDQRVLLQEALESKKDIILGARFIVASNDAFIYLAKTLDSKVTLPKKIKDLYRRKGIPPKIRPVLFSLYGKAWI
ncbi:tRNA lysidine(34) synthetase TilS [Helicobacter sp. 11S02629-2]|uniref:tRNA lysidine(34) synthetase TilS n=1 Tax=Helicobacter sp. 11S02629-2 TaxID=1476195 RepID=UPI000BA639F1|nr:tRNA lysidine(34) synthetase TilS [Helicobacter sp. 11S02629-2]PAF43683.1 tRNA lysidine(34) synthetase TilS [Helicobacter sp. 11S02629-2]